MNGYFRLAHRIECNSCGSVVMAQHVAGPLFRIACWKEGCEQSGKEYTYEQPLLELREAEEGPKS